MKPTHKELFDELKIAMNSNPDLCMFDTLRYVTEKTYPNRIYTTRNPEDYPYSRTVDCEDWKLTNTDILKALKQFNARV